MFNFEIREGQIQDAQRIARVHIECWQTTYKGIVNENFLANLSLESRIVYWKGAIGNPKANFVFVAEAPMLTSSAMKEIIGFISGGANRTENTEFSGELGAIYVLLQFQKSGIGRKLVHHLVLKLIESGHNSMLVWVLSKNPYRRFYEKLGGKFVRAQTIRIGDDLLEEIAYGWKDLSGLLELTESD